MDSIKFKAVKEIHGLMLQGLNISYRRMLEFKNQKGTTVVIERDGKIIELTPEQVEQKLDKEII